MDNRESAYWGGENLQKLLTLALPQSYPTIAKSVCRLQRRGHYMYIGFGQQRRFHCHKNCQPVSGTLFNSLRRSSQGICALATANWAKVKEAVDLIVSLPPLATLWIGFASFSAVFPSLCMDPLLELFGASGGKSFLMRGNTAFRCLSASCLPCLPPALNKAGPRRIPL